jgi:hypothetical protein
MIPENHDLKKNKKNAASRHRARWMCAKPVMTEDARAMKGKSRPTKRVARNLTQCESPPNVLQRQQELP